MKVLKVAQIRPEKFFTREAGETSVGIEYKVKELKKTWVQEWEFAYIFLVWV
jgi:hypothetical protein